MKYLLIIILVIVSFVNIVFSQGTKPNDKKAMRFIYSFSAMHVASLDDANAVSRILSEHIRKKVQRVEKIEIVICKDSEEIVAELKSGYTLLVLSINEFLSLRKQYHLTPSFVNESNGSVGFNYLLVVNRNEQISSIRQLKGTEIYLETQGNQKIPEMLLNKLLEEQKFPTMDKFFGKITKNAATNNVVLPVFFKKAKAALVSEQSMKVLSEINPQIEKQLKVIFRSPDLLLGVACFDENTIAPEDKILLTEVLTTLHTDPYGKQLLNLFVTDKLIPFKDEYLNSFLNYFGNKIP